MTEQDYAVVGQPSIVKIMATARPRKLRPGAVLVVGRGQGIGWLIPAPERHRPPDDIPPSVPARLPLAAPQREVEAPPGLVKLLANLAARGARSDDQHGSGRELFRIAILACGQLQDAG